MSDFDFIWKYNAYFLAFRVWSCHGTYYYFYLWKEQGSIGAAVWAPRMAGDSRSSTEHERVAGDSGPSAAMAEDQWGAAYHSTVSVR